MKHLSSYIKAVTLLSGITLLNACNSPEKQTEQIPVPVEKTVEEPAEAKDYALLAFDASDAWLTEHVFSKEYKAAELSEVELRLTDSLMEAFLATYNKEEVPKILKRYMEQKPKDKAELSWFSIDLKLYKKQYIAVLNAKGEKEVWANCFSKAIEERIEFTDWKKIPVRVSGGGANFFNLKVNLAQRTIYDFKVNSKD